MNKRIFIKESDKHPVRKDWQQMRMPVMKRFTIPLNLKKTNEKSSGLLSQISDYFIVDYK